MLQNKGVLLGVTGGIAAYKALELVRLLKKNGASVHVVMTRSAQEFVGKLSFEVLSENPVLTDLWTDAQSVVPHIDLASMTQAAIVAPATANCVAKLAHGIADDALTTTLLAVTGPILVCPAMNTQMYENPAVQQNLDTLKNRGMFVLEPDAGFLACKAEGKGRLPDPAVILDRFCAALYPKDLAGKKILISAGPTRESIDPVRYLTNHSSGKMGYAIARAAEQRGARVTLVSGPVQIPAPHAVDMVPVCSCQEMAHAMTDHFDQAEIIIKVAAVADFRPETCADKKIKKQAGKDDWQLSLVKNPDILKTLGARKKPGQFLVGFAAETNDLKAHALEKMEKKNLDMIVANEVGKQDSGFQADTNRASLFFRNGSSQELDLMGKDQLAHKVLDAVLQQMGRAS